MGLAVPAGQEKETSLGLQRESRISGHVRWKELFRVPEGEKENGAQESVKRSRLRKSRG